jgi:hypothetical protein
VRAEIILDEAPPVIKQTMPLQQMPARQMLRTADEVRPLHLGQRLSHRTRPRDRRLISDLKVNPRPFLVPTDQGAPTAGEPPLNLSSPSMVSRIRYLEAISTKANRVLMRVECDLVLSTRRENWAEENKVQFSTRRITWPVIEPMAELIVVVAATVVAVDTTGFPTANNRSMPLLTVMDHNRRMDLLSDLIRTRLAPRYPHLLSPASLDHHQEEVAEPAPDHSRFLTLPCLGDSLLMSARSRWGYCRRRACTSTSPCSP